MLTNDPKEHSNSTKYAWTNHLEVPWFAQASGDLMNSALPQRGPDFSPLGAYSTRTFSWCLWCVHPVCERILSGDCLIGFVVFCFLFGGWRFYLFVGVCRRLLWGDGCIRWRGFCNHCWVFDRIRLWLSDRIRQDFGVYTLTLFDRFPVLQFLLLNALHGPCSLVSFVFLQV